MLLYEPTVQQALEEIPVTCDALLSIIRRAPVRVHEGVTCSRSWRSQAGTFTYHTHTVVENIDAMALDHIASLFYNAYSLPGQAWYSQFVRGQHLPLPCTTTVEGQHQLGQGLFQFGFPALRTYHTLFSLVSPDADTRAVILRTINEPLAALEPAKRVYLLPPSGDVFVHSAGNLHWHHICTTSGIGLLPGAADRWLMNLLRILHLDTIERRTYLEEGEGFIRFVREISAMTLNAGK